MCLMYLHTCTCVCMHTFFWTHSFSLWLTHNCPWAASVNQSIKVTLRLTVSQSVSLGIEPHLGPMTRYLLLVWQLRSCSCGAPSLMRGQVCLLYVLLALASSVFLRSESLGTSDRILLSQIWDFPFCRLLRLAGSQWMYLTPPPHGSTSVTAFTSLISTLHRLHRKYHLYCWWHHRLCRSVFTEPFLRNGVA
jgi:hypothetical protein